MDYLDTIIGWWQPEQHTIAVSLFLRILGVMYFLAFSSLIVQVKGLLGRRGILPVRDFLAYVRRIGPKRFYYIPSVFWLSSSDAALLFMCLAGMAAAVLLAAGIAPLIMLIILYVSYLSFKSVGEDFLNFQWDALLLEVGFASILLAAAPSMAALLLVWFILFKFMVMAGMAKIVSKDQNWRSLKAMAYHYQTQPLPNPLSWAAHNLPLWFHKLSVAGMLVIEIAVPMLIFGPADGRTIAFWLFAALQFAIAATGNFGPFNLFSTALAIPLLDDNILSPFASFLLPLPPAIPAIAVDAAAVLLIIASSVHIIRMLFPGAPGRGLLNLIEPFDVSNPYGLFAVMTTKRYEIIMEWSKDGEKWHEYAFRWKPQGTKASPPVSAPHMPRLDWMMWFLPFAPYESNPWFLRFMEKLLQNSPEVCGLLRTSPDEPPRFVRALAYEYTFTDPATRKRTGDIWSRRLTGEYAPKTSIRDL
ncbi:MAG: lipase maturation factor family protein [Candidatus Micrarchaeia archaeon]